MVTTFTGYNIPANRRKSLPPRKKGLQCGLLAGLQLLSELPLWVSTSVASCVRVINSITARSTTSSRMPGIVSAQQITAPEFSFHHGLMSSATGFDPQRPGSRALPAELGAFSARLAEEVIGSIRRRHLLGGWSVTTGLNEALRQSLYTAVIRRTGVNLHPDCGAGAAESCEKKEEILPGTTPQNRATGVCAPP